MGNTPYYMGIGYETECINTLHALLDVHFGHADGIAAYGHTVEVNHADAVDMLARVESTLQTLARERDAWKAVAEQLAAASVEALAPYAPKDEEGRCA